MFTLDQLRSFVAVAEELHFGRAAERLNMTQPPLSRQIQKLEKSVGVELLERDNRKVTLTDAGRVFLADAKRVLVAADRAPFTARKVAAGKAGVIRLGFTAASGFNILGALLSEIDENLPDVDVQLRELVTAEQLQALQDGDLDMGLARPPFDTDVYESRLLLSEQLRLAVPVDHPLNRLNRPIKASDLADAKLIMHSPTQARYFYDLAIKLMPIQHGNVVHTVSQILTMVALVGAGHGVAFVPESARYLGIEGVEYLYLDSADDISVEVHAIWRRGSKNPALRRLISILTAGKE